MEDMDVDNSKTANKVANWKKKEVSTLLGVCEAHSNKQAVTDPTYKNADVAILTDLSKQMREQGYDRPVDQIRRKIKKLQASYRQVIAGVDTL